MTLGNADGSLDPCSFCKTKDAIFEILGVTKDGFLTYQCIKCKTKFFGDAPELAGVKAPNATFWNT